MDKLTSILAVVENSAGGEVVLNKAVALARRFDARVELLTADGPLAEQFAHCFAAEPVWAGESLRAAIQRRALESRADLVIKAPAGNHPLRRWTLSANDCELASECPAPLLLAGAKPWAKSMRLAAAVDVSDAETTNVARAILQTAGFLTLGCRGNLDILYSEREPHDQVVRRERAVKLAQLVREYHVGRERLQMFAGPPQRQLPLLISARQYDLLVLGATSHRPARAFELDSLTSKLVDATDGDVLLVKSADTVRYAAPAEIPSARDQGAYHRQQLV